MKRTCLALLLAALGCIGCCGTGGKCWNTSEKEIENDAEHPKEDGWVGGWSTDPDNPSKKRRIWVKGGIY